MREVRHMMQVNLQEITTNKIYDGTILFGTAQLSFKLKFKSNWQACQQAMEAGSNPLDLVTLTLSQDGKLVASEMFRQPVMMAHSIFIHMKNSGINTTQRWIKVPMIAEEEHELFKSPEDILQYVRELNEV